MAGISPAIIFMVNEVEIKVGCKHFVLRDDVLTERTFIPVPMNDKSVSGLVSDTIIVGAVYLVFGKTLGGLMLINAVVTNIVKRVI